MNLMPLQQSSLLDKKKILAATYPPISSEADMIRKVVRTPVQNREPAD